MFTALLLAQLALPVRPIQPVLHFPDPVLDDTAAYRGYRTRFFRDAARNTLQVYVDDRSARVVHLMADADNASIGFTARDGTGRTASLAWGGPGGRISADGRSRRFEHRLTAASPVLHLGWFLLGTMRVERDFQYEQRAAGAFANAPYHIPDVDAMLTAMATLDAPTRTRHLQRLHANSVDAVRERLSPRPSLRSMGAQWVATVRQVTLDAGDTLTLEMRANRRDVDASVAGDSLTLRSRAGRSVSFDVRIATTARALSPLARTDIFTDDFLRFLRETRARGAAAASASDAAITARRMERQVVGVELLVSREKLMAGLPTYATYFGRDMLMTALMMQPIWRHTTLEAVIAATLRKLGRDGAVSHEEAVGDQAVRESAGEYARRVTAAQALLQRNARDDASAELARADSVLQSLRTPRENYHMIDDEYQFAIVVARWITDPSVPAAAKRAFLRDTADGGVPRVERLVQALGLVAELTAPYVSDARTANLIGFRPGPPLGWGTASWRDSGAGYAGGRYAMDINAIWVPHALEATGQILRALRELDVLRRGVPAQHAALATYARDTTTLTRAIAVWRTARRHFVVTLSAADVARATAARLAAMPGGERAYWLAQPAADTAPLTFLAVALDSAGAPIGVANTDEATQLFLGDSESRRGGASSADERAQTLAAIRLFVRPYPTGLLVPGLGAVVANDTYATPKVWADFVKDPYHSPRVVWGREVNLFLLGVASRLRAVTGTGRAGDAAYAAELRAALSTVRTAVEASGFHTELWSYAIEAGRLRPMRYGSGGDIQLWSTTDLAVKYQLARLAP